MKKLLASLLVLAMCAPAMAVTFSTSATDNVLTISYDLAEGEVLRGLALTVARQSGDGVVANDQDHNFGPFNTFMDYAYMAPTEYQIDTGHPFAIVGAAGVATFPASEFSISMGYLDQNGVEPKGEGITEDGSITITFTGTEATEVAVALDTLRGGAVGDGLTTIDDSGLVNQTLKFVNEAIKSTAPFYNDWVTYGKPACWAFQRQCNGDATGTQEGNAVTGYKWVFNGDLNVLLTAYNVAEAPKGPGIDSIPNGICADFDHAREGNAVTGYKRVFNADLNILLANYNVAEAPKGAGVPVCDGTHYNFWTN